MKPTMHQAYQANRFSNLCSSSVVATKLLDSAFLLAVLLLYSSMFPFIFNLMQFFSSHIGKNYMFLLCNGILVFIVKNSGLMGNSYQNIGLTKNEGSCPQKAVELPDEMKTVAAGAGEKAVMEAKEVQDTEPMSLILVKEECNVPLTVQEVDEEIKRASISEEEEEEVQLLSIEELNKKCDDFIRKMKGKIRSDALQLMFS